MRFYSIVALGVAAVANVALGQNLIGVDFDNGAGSPTNWNTITSAGPFVVADLIDESGSNTGVGFQVGGSPTFSTSALASSLPTHSQSLAGLNDYMYGTNPNSAVFSGLTPGMDYNVWVFGLRGFTMGNDVTILGGGAPIVFSQDETTTNTLWVNGSAGSNAPLDSFAVVQSADALGAISINIADDPNAGGNGWAMAGLAIQTAVPEPGVSTLLATAGGLLALRRRRA